MWVGTGYVGSWLLVVGGSVPLDKILGNFQKVIINRNSFLL